jgi:hypothetical protein
MLLQAGLQSFSHRKRWPVEEADNEQLSPNVVDGTLQSGTLGAKDVTGTQLCLIGKERVYPQGTQRGDQSQ